jgi:hypothetical protein
MKKILILFLTILPLSTEAQFSRLGKDVFYEGTLTGAFSGGDYAPFWFTSNRYGLASHENEYGYLRGAVGRDVMTDSLRNWRVGYGVDLAVGVGMAKKYFVVQQLYADIQWKALRLSLGQKERPLELKNQLLSSGAMTTGINARPLPQVRLELPDFLAIPGTKKWLAIKAHIAYGWYTDNAWQRQFNNNTTFLYTSGSLYHSKAAFLRIGNKEKFPLTVTGGIEMSCQFGGTAYNILPRSGHGTALYTEDLFHGIKSYWNAFIPGGSDSNDGDPYKNSEGNQLGSWHLRADYHGKGWSVGAYLEHFFEDQSQMFWQYGWKDMLYGVEINLPKNPFLSSIVYEHIGTMDQSGPIYHDKTTNFPEQISGCDQYYNNHIYGAWQHSGYVMGNPLLSSPMYNDRFGYSNRLMVYHNRINAHHIGLSGQPTKEWGWRLLYTHEKSLGSYNAPTPNPEKANYLLTEVTYKPSKIKGLGITASYGHNDGEILGKSNGGMLTISFGGWINRTE